MNVMTEIQTAATSIYLAVGALAACRELLGENPKWTPSGDPAVQAIQAPFLEMHLSRCSKDLPRIPELHAIAAATGEGMQNLSLTAFLNMDLRTGSNHGELLHLSGDEAVVYASREHHHPVVGIDLGNGDQLFITHTGEDVPQNEISSRLVLIEMGIHGGANGEVLMPCLNLCLPLPGDWMCGMEVESRATISAAKRVVRARLRPYDLHSEPREPLVLQPPFLVSFKRANVLFPVWSAFVKE